jgi:hypothetical protein
MRLVYRPFTQSWVRRYLAHIRLRNRVRRKETKIRTPTRVKISGRARFPNTHHEEK